jgi:transcription antitermination factor NusG
MPRRAPKPLVPACLLAIREGVEDEVERDLRRKVRIDAWSPQYLDYRSDGPVAVALFPGYAFARIRDEWAAVLSTRGVYEIVRFGECIARVPEQLITELRAKCGATGYLQLQSRFGKLARVRIAGGSSGAVGIVQARESATRVRVLFQLLGRNTEMSVPDKDLVAA